MRNTKIIILSIILMSLVIFPISALAQPSKVIEEFNEEVQRLINQGNYQEAIQFLQRFLEIAEKAGGPDTPAVSYGLYHLAICYSYQGRYGEAEPLYKRALQIEEKQVGSEHPHIACIIDSLASDYLSQGRFAEAEPLYKRALAIREKALGLENPEVATSLNNIASLYREQGEYAQSEPVFIKALAMYEKTLGKKHPYTAMTLNNLAMLYYRMGNYAKAEPLYNRALTIREGALGPKHPDVANNLNDLAMLYYDMGQFDHAESFFNRALVIYENTFGFDHPYVTSCNDNLAVIYLSRGDINKAISMFKKYDDQVGLGSCYLAINEYKKAEDSFQQAFRLFNTIGKKDNIIASNIGLGLSYEGLGDNNRAKEHFGKAIEIIESQWKELSFDNKRNFLSAKVGLFPRLAAYEGMVRVILKESAKNSAQEALAYAERVKSRTLLEMLAARGAQGVEQKDREILDKDREYQQQIAMLRKQITILADLGTRAPHGEKETAEKTLAATEEKYEQFINEVKLQNTELASLVTVEVTPVDKIQAALDPSTTVVEYFTTKDTTYVWLISRDAVTVHEIKAGEKALEVAVNNLLLPTISSSSRRPWPSVLAGEEQRISVSES